MRDVLDMEIYRKIVRKEVNQMYFFLSNPWAEFDICTREGKHFKIDMCTPSYAMQTTAWKGACTYCTVAEDNSDKFAIKPNNTVNQ